ncbi:MAG TPA: hypothetical protein VFF68_13035 [Anaerolineaceae bacterium]|nr:hypothetical protein [Anaerolineaceae bacterium]
MNRTKRGFAGMELSDLEKIRMQKAERLRARGEEPYPTRAHPTHTTQEAKQAFEQAESSGDPVAVTVVGRLRSMRPMGKIIFAHIEDSTGRFSCFYGSTSWASRPWKTSARTTTWATSSKHRA